MGEPAASTTRTMMLLPSASTNLIGAPWRLAITSTLWAYEASFCAEMPYDPAGRPWERKPSSSASVTAVRLGSLETLTSTPPTGKSAASTTKPSMLAISPGVASSLGGCACAGRQGVRATTACAK